MNRSLKIATLVLRFAIIGALLVVVSLVVAISCFESSLPRWAVNRLEAKFSTDDYILCIDSVSFKLTRGVRVTGLRLLDHRKAQAAPFLSAERVDLNLGLEHLPWRLESLVREVEITGLKLPRLPDGYYIPDSIEFPGQPDYKEVNAPVDVTFPSLATFRLKLIRPDVLSVRPEFVEAAAVSVQPKLIRVSGIFVKWPDFDARMTLDGETVVDLNQQTLRGSVHGQARQPNARPMLGTLEITNCYQFVDAFTGVTTPVDATCQFDVNLVNNDLHIFLDLHPTGGSYRGVPFKDAHGLVDIRVFVRDTYQNAKIVVGPVTANFPDGKSMEGTIVYENTNDVGYVSFDVRSTVALSNALAVADVFTHGTLDGLQPETPPEITLKGTMAVDPAYSATNDLSGTIEFRRGRLFSVPLKDAYAKFRVRGDHTDFFEARANTNRGGELTGSGLVSYPDATQTNSTFGVDVKGKDIPLADLADIFGFATDERHGLVNGEITLAGPLGSDILPLLKSRGSLKVQQGNLARLNLLSGLFDAMAGLPGLASLVKQTREATGVTISDLSMSYDLVDGVLSSSDVLFQGGIFTIACKGSYDLVRDELDFVARVKIVKDDSFLGMLKNPILWPFSKLSTMLFGFRVSGPLSNPVWRYDTAMLNRFR